MKLRNKKTGQEGNFIINKDHFECVDLEYVPEYRNLAELNEEWEDYEEPKGYWYYDTTSAQVDRLNYNEDKEIDSSIGNCFETKEEAEKAVEKLKAWKRLKDSGFEFKKWESYEETTGLSFPDRNIVNSYTAIFDFNKPCRKYELENGVKVDLDLLFGGEDE